MSDDPTAAPQRPGSGSTRALVIGLALTVLVLVGAGVVAVQGATEGPEPAGISDGATDLEGQAQQPTLEDRPAATDSAPLPDTELEGFGGEEAVALGDYRGTPLVVNFWGTWCPPCVEEMPAFQEVADAGGESFALLGVNVQDDRDKAEALVESLSITYDLAIDHDGSLFEEVEGFGMPTTLLVDADGDIRYRHTGPLEAEALADLLRERLGVEVAL